MRVKLIIGAVCTCLAIVSFNARAAILEGSFTATVTSSSEFTQGSGLGWVYNDLVGDTIIGTIRIDASLAPTDSTPASYFRTYESIVNDWIDISLSLNGRVTDLEGTATQRVQTVNHDAAVNNTGFDQWGTMVDDSYHNFVDNNNEDKLDKYISFSMMDYTTAILDTDNLDQSFTWDFTDSNIQGSGSLSVDNYTKIGGTVNENYYRVGFNLNSLSLQETVVPIPAAAWLFGSGLIGLVGLARRKKS